MSFRSLVGLAAFALALSTIGCSADASDDSASSANDVTVKVTKEVIATESDAGKTVQVTEGDDFVLELVANGTTGYQWKVTDTDRSFAYPYASPYEAPSASGPVGAGGTQVFKWSTVGVSDAAGTPAVSKLGKHEITVEYRRPWESPAAPAAKSFSITVEVVAPIVPTEENNACGAHTCSAGQTCQMCWGAPACVPHGALC